MYPDPRLPVEIFRAPAKKPCLERALVLQARGLPHQVIGQPNDYRLVVPQAHAATAIEELSEYGEENVDWPPPRTAPPAHSNGRVVAASWVIVLTAVFPVGEFGFMGRDFWSAGKLVAGRVLDGEVWRAVTALTLHGGIGHLVSNLISGAAFLVLAAHTLGGGLALLCTLLAGALGNLLNAALQPPAHSAIGASTAVFGCLGLLVSYEWVRRRALGHTAMRRWAPVMAGAALLGYLGTGGGDSTAAGVYRTDVLAHVTGFVAGALLGLVAGRTRLPDRLGPLSQRACAAIAGLIVSAGWVAALV